MQNFHEKKPESKITKPIRAALAGAAFLGAVSVAPPAEAKPINDRFGATPKIEQQESFVERETAAFLNYIAAIEKRWGDADEREKNRTIIEMRFSSFVLALEQHVPVFSAKGNVSLNGAVTMESRARAAKLLLPKIQERSSENNYGLTLLKKIIAGSDIPPEKLKSLRDAFDKMEGLQPRSNSEQKRNDTGNQPSEIRRNRTKDW